MRYTRTKQLIRLTYGKYWEYMPNASINEMRELLSDYELDKSFKWHREYKLYKNIPWGYNFIEFQGKIRLVHF